MLIFSFNPYAHNRVHTSIMDSARLANMLKVKLFFIRI